MNIFIAALTNYLFCTLSKKDFLFWNVFFSELSKSMFGMEILREICRFEEREEHEHHHHHPHDMPGDKSRDTPPDEKVAEN
ncbi:MAG: hypothetical protein FWH20_08580 [Oscillospiraceae bacterium]|nr:hypothetical protein [Oscillospiraceae bacterium]